MTDDEAGEYGKLDVHISPALDLGAMARDARRLRQMPRHRLSAESVECRIICEAHQRKLSTIWWHACSRRGICAASAGSMKGCGAVPGCETREVKTPLKASTFAFFGTMICGAVPYSTIAPYFAVV